MDINDLVTFEVNGKKCVALVRKLTERECGRLMGCDDADIETIANCGVSRSSQYKMYGNSIVVDVLYHIFRTAFIPSERGDSCDLFGGGGLIQGEFTKDHPLRVATLCSGYDSQFMALDRLHHDYPEFCYKRVWFSEFDPESTKPLDEQPAVIAHKALYPDCPNLGDMTKIDWAAAKEKYGEIDFLFYSTPCLTSDSLILTDKGYIELKNIKEGDVVLTKSNVLHSVVKKFDNGVHPTCYIHGTGFDSIHCTYNHKFYVREMYRYGHKAIRKFKDPEFVEARNLTRKHYLGFPVNNEALPFLSEDPEFWYLAGYYIGDGWLPSRPGDNDVILACNDKKLEKLKKRLSQDKWKYTIQNGRTCKRLRFANHEIHNVIRDTFGTGSKNKRIPYDVVRLPNNLLQSFLDGYIDSDGCRPYKNYIQFSTANRNIAYTTQLIIAKLYHRVTSIAKVKVEPTKTIQGRVINQSPYYLLRAKTVDNIQDKSFYEDGYIWYPFKHREDAECEHVYNFEVEEDHSYIVNGAMSKNCQSISQAGLQHGFTEGSGTRSSIIWNVRDALRILQPRFACLENVAAMVSAKFKPLFDLWRQTTVDLGYESFAKMLNAKNYGVPQNRERIFLFSVHKEKNGGEANYNFPKPFGLIKKLRDLLEDETDVKYYLNPVKVQEFAAKNLVKIREYAEKGFADGQKIEKLPAHLRKWIEEYEDKGQGGDKVPVIDDKGSFYDRLDEAEHKQEEIDSRVQELESLWGAPECT